MVNRRRQLVGLFLVLGIVVAPAAALANCDAMQQAAHCPQAAAHCTHCPDVDSSANFQPQPAPMDGPCCQVSPARPAPQADLQSPSFAPAGVPAVHTGPAVSPALPTPLHLRREAVLLLPMAAPQAVLCTFLI